VIADDDLPASVIFFRETVGSEAADSDEEWDVSDRADVGDVFVAIQPLKQAIQIGTAQQLSHRTIRNLWSFTGNERESQALAAFQVASGTCGLIGSWRDRVREKASTHIEWADMGAEDKTVGPDKKIIKWEEHAPTEER